MEWLKQEKASRHFCLPIGPTDQSNTFRETPHVEWINGDQWNRTVRAEVCKYQKVDSVPARNISQLNKCEFYQENCWKVTIWNSNCEKFNKRQNAWRRFLSIALLLNWRQTDVWFTEPQLEKVFTRQRWHLGFARHSFRFVPSPLPHTPFLSFL